jgi:hypothetical protein
MTLFNGWRRKGPLFTLKKNKNATDFTDFAILTKAAFELERAYFPKSVKSVESVAFLFKIPLDARLYRKTENYGMSQSTQCICRDPLL